MCGKKATKRFSPDLDIKGIGACKKHVKQVQIGYIALITGQEKNAFNIFGLGK